MLKARVVGRNQQLEMPKSRNTFEQNEKKTVIGDVILPCDTYQFPAHQCELGIITWMKIDLGMEGLTLSCLKPPNHLQILCLQSPIGKL